ncbi:Vanillate O-demethylase oxidoreductase [Pandoraea terrae]|uniref:Vanillate O-demethylase oxidoreductase n=1 Tax=Pandoraea terrae TaxID=1537710 RepID=A0A5E4XPY8_9BURK|nr:PDR/VanB family oxidoreductase [Pandoraea terrae]VVE38449.1 Vanillate O-demethylase oxidoreductase [Pandoraea terrae]
MQDWIEVQIRTKTVEATDICSFELVDPTGAPLPPFTAGAHVDVQVLPGLTRQYSLCNKPSERHRYVIAVLRDPASRGGSRAMHDEIHQGALIKIGKPRNLFPLDDKSLNVLLLAGGIGVTPILCMAEQLAEKKARFSLHYCARSAGRMAFRERIESSAFANRSVLHFDEGPPSQRLDISMTLAECGSETHIYVCGPTGFIEWVLGNARQRDWPESRLHREYFAAPAQAVAQESSFEVQLARTGKIYTVPPEKSVAEVLAAHGIDIPVSCEQGVCGTCLTRVLAGEPEHRDTFLTPLERARNDQFTPCCSRARGARLVIDL